MAATPRTPRPHRSRASRAPTRALSSDEIAAFRETVLGHYEREGRDLPWRQTRDPYAILIAEVMLQQTQVSRVERVWPLFVERFPDFASLAAAPLAEVLAVWQGLGYNRRARALRDLAGAVVAEHGGKLPRTLGELTALPGLGHATAAQVLAFAFGTGVPFIETNIRTVFLHHFFPAEDGVPDSAVLPLVRATLDTADPRTWYYALMDYGAELKRALPNPSRRSAHHARQSAFEGSDRQLRGAVLRALLGQSSRTTDEIAVACSAELAGSAAATPERLSRVLDALLAEGLVAEDCGRFSIA